MTVFSHQYFKTGSIFYACLVFFVILYACKNKRSKNDYLHAYENKLGIRPSKLAQIDTVNFTTIEWINPVRNFGTVKEGDSVTIVFRCKNTGDNPLFLSDIHSPCGCTVPHYTEKVILPGEEDELPVYFNTVGQEKSVHKSIVVTSNTSNGAKHALSFEGEITSADKSLKKDSLKNSDNKR
jgi:Protein of unknown function (DUF1573)